VSPNTSAFRFGLFGTLGVGVALLIWGAFGMLSTIITYICIALFISFGLEPSINFLMRRKIPRPWAVLIIILIFIGLVVGILFMIVPPVVAQISALVLAISNLNTDSTFQSFLASVQHWINQYLPEFNIDDVLQHVFTWIQENLGNIGGAALQFGMGLASATFGLIVVLIMTIYFSSSMPSMRSGIAQMIPKSKREKFTDITTQMIESVGKYVSGLVVQATINGTLTFIVLSIAGAPYPALLAVLAFLGSVIPLVGPMISSTIIVVITFFGAGLWPTIWVAIFLVIYMQLEPYVISPRIMGQAVKLPGIIILISALIGGTLAGLLGALVAIPVAASVMIIVKQIYIPKQDAS